MSSYISALAASSELIWTAVVNYSGSFVVKPEYQDVRSFCEGFAPVRRNCKWGLTDLDGVLVVEFQFDELGALNGGLAPAKLDRKAGFVSAAGLWAIQPAFDRCYQFFGKLAVARKGSFYFYLRRDGETVWASEPGAIVQAPPIAA
jgi:hypothetical protein